MNGLPGVSLQAQAQFSDRRAQAVDKNKRAAKTAAKMSLVVV